jgi:D-alanine-D-alanine ligase
MPRSRTRVLIAQGGQPATRNGAGKLRLDRNILGTVLDVEKCLLEKGCRVEKARLTPNPASFLRHFQAFRPHVIFNLVEDVAGDATKEKSAIGLFELLGVPFTGNGNLPIAVCLNKAMAKRILLTASMPTPAFRVIHDPRDTDLDFSFPAIVKPLREDGSLGITARSVVNTRAQLSRRVAYVRDNFRQPALVEKFVEGREFQVSLLGNRRPRVLAVSELSYEGLPAGLPRIVTYSAKWHTESKYYKHTTPVVPARAEPALVKKLAAIARGAWEVFELRGYARVDFRVRRDHPYVVDVNPNPDISADAGLAKAARHAGLSYADLIFRVVRLALE